MKSYILVIAKGKMSFFPIEQEDLTLSYLQKMVDGTIAMPFQFPSRHRENVALTLVCNDEGKLLESFEPNIAIQFMDDEGHIMGEDVIFGPVAFVGGNIETGETIPLTEKEIQDVVLIENAVSFLELQEHSVRMLRLPLLKVIDKNIPMS